MTGKISMRQGLMWATALTTTAVLAGCSSPDTSPDTSPDSADDIQAVVGEGWELVWHDEFDGDEIDLTKWTHEVNCWGGGNAERQCYTDRSENSFIRDGKLVIRAIEEEFTGPVHQDDQVFYSLERTTTLPYTSARLRSKEKGDWTYGRIEVRAKIPGGQGAWPAIWMLPTDWEYGGWAASGEIDIMEAVNLGTTDELMTHGTLHYGGEWPRNKYSGTSYKFTETDPREEFHTYAIEWAEDEIRWYVDDVHFATQPYTAWFSASPDANGNVVELLDGEPFDKRFHLLLNVAVGGAWPGNPDDTTVFPLEMEVDFVRVFSCPSDPLTLAGCGTINPDATIVTGQRPIQETDVDYDPEFINQDVVTVFDDGVVGPYLANSWTASGSVDLTIVSDGDRGDVMQITYDTDQSVAYFQSASGFNFSEFDRLEFDLKVVTDPRTDDNGIFIKMDCFHPCGTGDYFIDTPVLGEWTSYSISLADLVAFEGSSLDLTNVNTPFVIAPTFGNQQDVVLLVDNIRVVRP